MKSVKSESLPENGSSLNIVGYERIVHSYGNSQSETVREFTK